MVFSFKSPDFLHVLRGQSDIIQSFEQASLFQWVDFKGVFSSVRCSNKKSFEINGDFGTNIFGQLATEILAFFLG